MATLASLLPMGILQFTDGNGSPLAGGSVTFYQPNTTVLKAIWADPGELTALANPLPLDSAGRPQTGSSEVEIYGSGQYSMLVADAFGNTVWGPVLTQDPLSLAAGAAGQSVPYVVNIAALRTLASRVGVVFVQGYSSAGDGGGGIFYLGAAAPDNACTVIVSAAGTYYRDLMGESLSIMALGATADGAADDASALARIGAALPHGGTVVIPPGKVVNIASNLTIPASITLQGPYGYIGEVAGSHAAGIPWTNYVTMTIGGTVQLTVGSGFCLTGCLVYRTGMTFPTTTTAGFIGTPFLVSGDNVMFRNSMIMGFAQAISSSGFDRLMVEDMSFDNLGNISIVNSNDTAKIIRCHAWPFSSDSPTQTALTRSGYNLYVANSTDACMVTDCFAYGYAVGFYASDAGAITFVNCDADNSDPTIGTGFLIGGTGAGSRAQLIGCQAYSLNDAFLFANTGGAEMILAECTTGGCQTSVGVNPGSNGIVRMHGNYLYAGIYGVLVESANVEMDIDDNMITGMSIRAINSTINTNNLNIGDSNRFGLLSDSSVGLQVTSSTVFIFAVTPGGSVLSLPVVGRAYAVTAGQNFGTLNGGWAGRVVTLVFEGVTQVFSGTGTFSSMALSGGATFTSVANGTLTLLQLGTGWVEIGRG